jgi:hypothetical protein
VAHERDHHVPVERLELVFEGQPELADVRIVRGPQDFHPMMPAFQTAFLAYVWAQE